MKQLSLSVIIPAYNEAQTIVKTLDSLVKQTHLPQEIIVIDDGSTDETGNQVKKYQTEYPLIKLLKQAHLGPAKARNLAAQAAQAQVLVFVDADMEFSPDFLLTLTRPIFQGKAQGTWSGNEWVKNWQNVWARCWNYNQNRREPLMVGNHRGQKPVFRAIFKSEFLKVKGFDSIGYTDDWTLVTKLGYLPKPTQAKFYHYNPQSLTEVFSQAFWIGKRQYKLNKLGILITLVKVNPLFSLFVGLAKGIKFLEPRFLIFKLVYDWGIFRGALAKLIKDSRY